MIRRFPLVTARGHLTTIRAGSMPLRECRSPANTVTIEKGVRQKDAIEAVSKLGPTRSVRPASSAGIQRSRTDDAEQRNPVYAPSASVPDLRAELGKQIGNRA